MNKFFCFDVVIANRYHRGKSFAQPPVYEQRSYIKNGKSEAFFINNMVVRHVSL